MTEKTAAEFVMDTLRKAGFESFLAGGCVRDLMLGREPHDYDVTTIARPEQVAPLFAKTTPVGAAFGVVVVLVEDVQIQVATYRADGTYSDGRHPDEVHYSDSAEEDVKRRDFTMNGLLMPPALEEKDLPQEKTVDAAFERAAMKIRPKVRDYVGGMEDIRNKVIRCIGDPFARFSEDALRMLRAVRFAATLGFTIEENTYAAIVDNVELIRNVSRERIREELEKLVAAPYPVKGLLPLATSGLLSGIFAEVAHGTGEDFAYDLRFQQTLQRFNRFTAVDNPKLGIAMLFADCPNTLAVQAALKSLKFSTEDETEIFNAVINQQMCVGIDRFNMSDADVKLLARVPGVLRHGLELWEQSAYLFYAYDAGSILQRVSRYRNLLPEDIRPTLFVTGKDLIAMGFTPGPMFTTVLGGTEYRQLNGEFETAEQALDYAKKEAERITAPPSAFPEAWRSKESGATNGNLEPWKTET